MSTAKKVSGKNQNNAEVIAAITAAIAAFMETETSSFVIKKISSAAKKTSVWSRAGRLDCMRSRQLF